MFNLMKPNKKYFTALLLCCISQAPYALTLTPGHPYIGGIADASFAQLEHNHQHITYYSGDLTDYYPLHHDNNAQLELGLNGGYEFIGAGYMPAIALGLGVYGNPANYNFSGQVSEAALGDPRFLLYNYHYQVNSTRLIAEAQFTWQVCSFAPFVNVGIGPSWNRLSGYTETVASVDGFVAAPPFKSQTNTNFAYQVGLGVGYMFNFKWNNCDFKGERLSLGYRYMNAGNVSSGTRGATYPHRLNAGNLSSNNLYLSYTHLFA